MRGGLRKLKWLYTYHTSLKAIAYLLNHLASIVHYGTAVANTPLEWGLEGEGYCEVGIGIEMDLCHVR